MKMAGKYILLSYLSREGIKLKSIEILLYILKNAEKDPLDGEINKQIKHMKITEE